jgi:hypothetical protein
MKPARALRIEQDQTDVPADIVVPPDAWRVPRAALFLGVSDKTVERWVAQRMIPGTIVYPPGRGEGSKPIIAFDPVGLAQFRATYTHGMPSRSAR